MNLSRADRVRALPLVDRVRLFESLTAEEIAALEWCWEDFWARPDERDLLEPWKGRGQLPPPGGWTWWNNIGGRASGKTASCAQWVDATARKQGRGFVIHLLAQTPEDGVATMIDGQSGLRAVSPPWAGFKYQAVKEGGVLTWANGARGRLFGATVARKGRGPQCCAMWLDDPAAYPATGLAVLRQLLLGFRLRMPDGSEPRGVVSSTPIDTDVLDAILEGDDGRHGIERVYSYSTTHDNKANLAAGFFSGHLASIKGTDEEAQEVLGVRVKGNPRGPLNLDAPGSRMTFERVRVASPGEIVRLAVGVDPADGGGPTHDEWGIVVAGARRTGELVVLADASARFEAPAAYELVLELCRIWSERFPRASLSIVGEVNRGAGKVASGIRAAWAGAELARNRTDPGCRARPMPPLVEVRTVDQKAKRAGPVRALYDSGLLLHVDRGLAGLELQMRAWNPLAPARAAQDDHIDGLLLVAHHLADLGGDAEPVVDQAEIFRGLLEAQEAIPAPAWGAGPMDGGWDRA